MIPYAFHVQHDDYGNAPHLLSPEDKEIIESGTFRRVGGDAECPICHKPNYKHPQVLGALWLRRGCEGLMKL